MRYNPFIDHETLLIPQQNYRHTESPIRLLMLGL